MLISVSSVIIYCKYFCYFLMAFVAIGHGTSFANSGVLPNPSCNEKRFQGQAEAVNLARSTSIERHILELSEREVERDALVQKLHITPLGVNFNQSITNTAELAHPLSKNQSETSELALSYNLNTLSRNAQQSLIKNRIQAISSEIRSLKNKHFAEKVNAVNDVVESEALDQTLLERLALVEKKIEYYKSLRAFGELNSEEISSAQTEFIELNDKILANKIKRNERLFFLGIDKVDTGAKDLLSMSLPTKLSANCSYQTESVKQIELAIGALETNLQLKNLAHRVDVSASASVSQTRTRQNYSDELRAGLSISVPLYDGGVVDAEKNEVIQKISIENKRLRDAKTIEASELTQRKNTEEVIIASLNSLSKKASNDLSRYYELQKRLDMGESVYIEKSNKRKEYLETLEAFLRLKYDMVEGWFDFLGRLDGFSEI